MNKKTIYYLLGAIAVIIIVILAKEGFKTNSQKSSSQSDSHILHVVAAENFYGDIAKQLGGNKVEVTSILSNPDTDPHEYEPTVQDGIKVSNAQIVIDNGDDYDTWMDKLLKASPNGSRVVITAGNIVPRKLADNPHVWYGVDNVTTVAEKITDTLKHKDSADAAVFDTNLQTFKSSLQALQQKMQGIKTNFANTPVALTETIYLYQTQTMNLNVLTPLSFEQAIAEGNDPSAQDVAKTNDQITNNQVKVLIYNSQTVTPVTTKLLDEAKQANIPVVSVTETMPLQKTYQTWMMGQLTDLQNALQKSK
jgi:zinc/manganese transport system substrate-binding protein